MEIVLARHAQPDWEPTGRAVDDPGLTQLGHEQAKLTAESLSDQRFDAFYTSPLRRAIETAQPISDALGIRPKVRSWLRELGLPSMQGFTGEQVQAFFREANARNLDQWWDAMPGGESFRHFYERVSSGIEGMLKGDHRLGTHEVFGHRIWRLPESRERILIVAHEGTNAVLISHLLGIEPVPFAWMRFSHAWAGISVVHTLEVAGGAVFGVESFNRTNHLASLRTHPGWLRDGRTQS
ncbi:MAG: histidine phosphatase family protein [Myxococcota bacterium]|nr:histidine phosphatase family protein [bacterium]MDP6073734.1 histidine phosphatase family protein [Myxococcota bacterium]MDP6243562.1 histidine phosphatase family protein [Myxococcota bacterium]MDP7074670.1 histidine phosphatase family protein [Myxococcota bacterium]MDP7299531.1 histidine phosphatase family protein [Myxococcota bacterium]